MEHIEHGRGAGRGAKTDGTGNGPPPADSAKGEKVRAMLRARLGEDIYSSWFHAIDFDQFDGRTVRATVPVAFLKTWIQRNYAEALLDCCAIEFKGAKRVEVVVREPGGTQAAAGGAQQPPATPPPGKTAAASEGPGTGPRRPAIAPVPAMARTHVNGFEGSPLDPRYTFDSFVVAPSNRMAHAAATQVAETVMAEGRGFNPLYLYAGVGHGKTHLQHAIAWEVKRRAPQARVLYLNADRFRYHFVDAIKSHDALAFKERFRAVDILLMDDLHFMGEKTEQEFEHIINAMLDGGRQVVVAAPRPPAQLEHLNDRMRSRLQRGLVMEIGPLDEDLRLMILERRIKERRKDDPTFDIPAEALKLLAAQLTQNGGRELEGAVNRLHLHWQVMRTPVTVDIAETIVRDLIQGIQPPRIKIEDILRVVSNHYSISRHDILSERRHRSVVRPRQVGMYLAKHLTSRSLPEIGRRFGKRDHTTVLHAIRKIDKEVGENPSLRDEIEALKRQLNR
ncbi:MAG TPA: chromosomal replication initiator protein DnaA [Hyphomicrobiaceae bacterium]|nr:chromosomal replication initiator protein DnaA [Hyphomicrobiaceae bacterium]